MRLAYRAIVQRATTMPTRSLLLLALPIFLTMGTAPASSQGYSYEEQEACTGDAFRLCSEFIPNIPRITACMQAKRDQLSPPCAKMFESGRERHLDDSREHPSGEFHEERRDDRF